MQQEEADKEAEGLKVAIVRAGKELPEDAVAPSDSCNTVRDRILTFLSKDLALMTLLANPGIKDRHWEQMAATVGFALPHSEVRGCDARLCMKGGVLLSTQPPFKVRSCPLPIHMERGLPLVQRPRWGSPCPTRRCLVVMLGVCRGVCHGVCHGECHGV